MPFEESGATSTKTGCSWMPRLASGRRRSPLRTGTRATELVEAVYQAVRTGNRALPLCTRDQAAGSASSAARRSSWLERAPHRATPGLPPRRPEQNRTDRAVEQARKAAEFALDFEPQLPYARGDIGIVAAQVPLHRPQRRTVALPECARLAREALRARVGRDRCGTAASPASSFASAGRGWAVSLEVALERPVKERLRLVARDGLVLEVELVLPRGCPPGPMPGSSRPSALIWS